MKAHRNWKALTEQKTIHKKIEINIYGSHFTILTQLYLWELRQQGLLASLITHTNLCPTETSRSVLRQGTYFKLHWTGPAYKANKK